MFYFTFIILNTVARVCTTTLPLLTTRPYEPHAKARDGTLDAAFPVQRAQHRRRDRNTL